MTYTPDFTIKLANGTSIQLLFNTWAIKHFCLSHNLEVEDMYGNFKAKELDSLMLVAHESYCKYSNIPFTATELDSCEWADALGGYNGAKMKDLIETFIAKSLGWTKKEYQERAKVVALNESKEKTEESPNA
jgi:hypothetical protein